MLLFFSILMIEQIQSLLNSPRHSSDDLLKYSQDLILNALEQMFPPEYDFTELAKLYENQAVTSSPPMLTYNLVKYFVEVVAANFVSVHSYESLQLQTQKLQANVRSHIKLEQQVKMYLQHLQSKISKYQNYLQHSLHPREEQHSNIQAPTLRQTTLLKERLSLIRRNEKLMNRIKEKEEELRKINKLNSSRLEMVQTFMEKDKLTISKSERKLQHVQMKSDTKSSKVHPISLLSPQQQQAIMINIHGSHNEVNYYTQK